MARPGKFLVKGTRGSDTITVEALGATVNGSFKPLGDTQIGVIVKGDAGDDRITGGAGPDEIDGGAGIDIIEGGAGFDKLVGGAGNDTLSDEDYRGAIFNGGRDHDTLDFSGSAIGVAVGLGGSVASTFTYDTVDGRPELDAVFDLEGRVAAVEDVVGSAYSDVLIGNRFDNLIRGGAYDDYLSGGLGNDTLDGEGDDDVLFGGDGNDHLTGGGGSDSFVFGFSPTSIEGIDVIHDYTPNVDQLVFLFGQGSPDWEVGSYNGQDSLFGTYDSGQSIIILVGIADVGEVTMEFPTSGW